LFVLIINDPPRVLSETPLAVRACDVAAILLKHSDISSSNSFDSLVSEMELNGEGQKKMLNRTGGRGWLGGLFKGLYAMRVYRFSDKHVL